MLSGIPSRPLPDALRRRFPSVSARAKRSNSALGAAPIVRPANRMDKKTIETDEGSTRRCTRPENGPRISRVRDLAGHPDMDDRGHGEIRTGVHNGAKRLEGRKRQAYRACITHVATGLTIVLTITRYRRFQGTDALAIPVARGLVVVFRTAADFRIAVVLAERRLLDPEVQGIQPPCALKGDYAKHDQNGQAFLQRQLRVCLCNLRANARLYHIL